MEDSITREAGPVEQLLSSPEKWIQQSFARLANGFLATTDDPDAVQFCLVGAMRHCYPNYYQFDTPAWSRLRAAFGNGISDVLTWNDAPERTFADVQALIQELNL